MRFNETCAIFGHLKCRGIYCVRRSVNHQKRQNNRSAWKINIIIECVMTSIDLAVSSVSTSLLSNRILKHIFSFQRRKKNEFVSLQIKCPFTFCSFFVPQFTINWNTSARRLHITVANSSSISFRFQQQLSGNGISNRIISFAHVLINIYRLKFNTGMNWRNTKRLPIN